MSTPDLIPPSLDETLRRVPELLKRRYALRLDDAERETLIDALVTFDREHEGMSPVSESFLSEPRERLPLPLYRLLASLRFLPEVQGRMEKGQWTRPTFTVGVRDRMEQTIWDQFPNLIAAWMSAQLSRPKHDHPMWTPTEAQIARGYLIYLSEPERERVNRALSELWPDALSPLHRSVRSLPWFQDQVDALNRRWTSQEAVSLLLADAQTLYAQILATTPHLVTPIQAFIVLCRRNIQNGGPL